MKCSSRFARLGRVAFCGLIMGSLACVAFSAQAAEPLKVALVSFYSGGVSGPVGIPSRNGGELMIEALNAGTVPQPYANTPKGAGGRPITSTYSDEAVDASSKVTEFRNMVQRRGVEVVIGYASSGSCLAVAPVAEELKVLTIFYYCGTSRIFEEGKRKYVFRTMATQDVENIAAARYILEIKPGIKSVSGMNQNYSWGLDSWSDFKNSLKQLKPSVEVKTEQFPKIFAGQYGAEITALMRANADAVHSSFWGGDMEAFILQGAPRGLFEDQTVILTTGGTSIYDMAKQIPEGTVIGARGPGDMFAPDSELNRWFRKAYEKKYGKAPTFPAYYMAQAVLAIKAAADKAAAKKGAPPSMEEIRAALVGLEYDSPSGMVRMARGDGHQAVTEVAYGTFALENGKPVMKNVRRYGCDCVNPPNGVKSTDWIKAGFPGAKCK